MLHGSSTLQSEGAGIEDPMSKPCEFQKFTLKLTLAWSWGSNTLQALGSTSSTTPNSASPEQTLFPKLQDCPETCTKAHERGRLEIPLKSTLLVWTKVLMQILPYALLWKSWNFNYQSWKAEEKPTSEITIISSTNKLIAIKYYNTVYFLFHSYQYNPRTWFVFTPCNYSKLPRMVLSYI